MGNLPFRECSELAFRVAFDQARKVNEQIREATSEYDPDQASQTRYYRYDRSGFAVREDGELVYVFSQVRGRGDAIVRAAISAGADHLDCFDGYLPKLYARHGFVEHFREPNWTTGGPDVVYMSRPEYATRMAARNAARLAEIREGDTRP